MTAPRPLLRTDYSRDARHLAPLPQDRLPPFIVVPGREPEADLLVITPFERGRPFSDREQAAIDAVREHLTDRPGAPLWVDATTGRRTPLGAVSEVWLTRRLFDNASVRLGR